MNDERFVRFCEAGSYIITGVCTVLTTLVAMEMMGVRVMDFFRRLRDSWERWMRRMEFEAYYEHVWPLVRKAQNAGQLDG